MRKPTVFLSSTIQDFSDLRSALKYFLEQQGCAVLASEYNDFPKPLEPHCYDACFATLQQADFFVLLIGARVGGWYDVASRTSITRQEYREAYKLHLEGRLKLINFVRNDVWRLRDDRMELSAFLEELDLRAETRTQIANYPTRRAGDAEVISQFISEVSRNQETQTALAGQSRLPTGNWLHVFTSFREVVEVLQTQVFKGTVREHATLRRLLLRELKEILRVSLMKTRSGAVLSPRAAVERFHQMHNLDLDSRDLEAIEVDVPLWDRIASMSVHLLTVDHTTFMLERALESPAFLTFDANQLGYREEPVYEGLSLLFQEIQRFRTANDSETRAVVIEHSPRGRKGRPGPLSIEPLKLFSLLHLMDRWVNIIELSAAIARHLQGRHFEMPALRPFSPVAGMDQRLKEEHATAADIDNLLATEA